MPLLALAALVTTDVCRTEAGSLMMPGGVDHAHDVPKPETHPAPDESESTVDCLDVISEIKASLAIVMLENEAIGLDNIGRNIDAEKFRKAHRETTKPACEVVVVINNVRYHVLDLKDKGQIFLFTTDGDPSEGKCLLIDGCPNTLPSETCRPGDAENTKPPVDPFNIRPYISINPE